MRDFIRNLLSAQGIELTQFQSSLAIFAIIIFTALLVHWLLHRVISRLVKRLTLQGEKIWREVLFEDKLFRRLALTIQSAIVYLQAVLWLRPEALLRSWLQNLSLLFMVLFLLLTAFSLLDAVARIMQRSQRSQDLPLRGVTQALKLMFVVVAVVLMVAIVVDRSPLLIISGLGAMTAVTMLIFKDPILGLVAGIQLSTNDMLRVGDWLDMPSYGADGEVIEIGLTTVKVQNWDKTITSIPTYALISGSFKNWQGMTQSGGRRIKRAVYIDATSVKFLDQEMISRLAKASLLAPYLDEKGRELDSYNQSRNYNMELGINGRRLTNIGTLRAYLTNYLKDNPGIHQEMTLMVRQLATEDKGIPLEIYAFTNTTAWAEYEQILSDIFDHLYAIIGDFDLRIHQSPGSADLRLLGDQLMADREGRSDTQAG
jgi:miniconductance mechanosensitive channel